MPPVVAAAARRTLRPSGGPTFAAITPPRKGWSRRRNGWSRWRNGWSRCRETGGHDAAKRVVTIARNPHATHAVSTWSCAPPKAVNTRAKRMQAWSRSLTSSARRWSSLNGQRPAEAGYGARQVDPASACRSRWELRDGGVNAAPSGAVAGAPGSLGVGQTHNGAAGSAGRRSVRRDNERADETTCDCLQWATRSLGAEHEGRRLLGRTAADVYASAFPLRPDARTSCEMCPNPSLVFRLGCSLVRHPGTQGCPDRRSKPGEKSCPDSCAGKRSSG